jgi:solute carrier family 39 (zinc transporter), member 1/2/3
MALGISTDHSSSLLLAASIGLHQPAESMALLVAFLKTGMPQATVMKWLALFSLVGPLGVTLGIFISRVASPIVEAAIVAMTAGTFLYVGATEIVGEEFDNVEGSEKWAKFAAFLGGMSTIFAGAARCTLAHSY